MTGLRHFLVAAAAALSLGASVTASAQVTLGNAGSNTPTVEIHGFISPGYIATTNGVNYLAESRFRPGDGQIGSFEFVETGLNVTSQVTNELRVGAQLFARDLGPTNNYTARFDWFYLDYRFADWFGVRAGRTKIPFGLYNEVNDVDAGRVPVLLPQSVYPIDNRDYLLAQTGGEVYGYLSLGEAGALDYRLYGGTIFVQATQQAGSPLAVRGITVPYLLGGRLMYETPLPGLRIGGSAQVLRVDTDIATTTPDPTTGAPMTAAVEIPIVLWVGSVEYAYNDLLLAAEYSLWHVSAHSSNTALFPDLGWTESQRLYLLAAYRVLPWFQPGIYYSLLFPNLDDIKGRENQQQDWAGTLRFDLNEHLIVKLEGHLMWGTAALSSALNDDKPTNQLPKMWGAFMLKTTAYF